MRNRFENTKCAMSCAIGSFVFHKFPPPLKILRVVQDDTSHPVIARNAVTWQSRKGRRTLDYFAMRAMTIFLLFIALPAHAQSAGDACSTANQIVRVQGAAGGGLICNGTTLEIYEGVLTTPLRHGIGTATPQATLDVNGYMKLKKNSSEPVACSATYDGAITLTRTYQFCICNGSQWITNVNEDGTGSQMGGGPCTW